MKYTTATAATATKDTLIAALAAAGLPTTGLIAELRSRVVEEEAEEVAAGTPTGNGAAINRLNEAAAVFGSLSLSGGTGAEDCPLASYTFATTSGLPTLIGGQWAEVSGVLTIIKDKYDAEGQSYHGKEKSVKLVAVHSTTNGEYRISAGAFQGAFKKAGKPVSFGVQEFKQVITESKDGYKTATVTLA